MDHLSERKATFQGRELYTEALKHGMGKVDLDGIRGQAKGEKDLIRVKERNIPSGRMTTTQALSLERANVRLMREGRDAGEAILQGKPFNPGKFLTPGQGKVAEHILTSRDQVLAVEGKAGAGKTYTLEAVVSTAKAEGWEVRGFAPTNKAAASLREAGLSTKTIAALGLEKGPGGRGRQLWIVDEAGLMSSRGAEIVLRKAQEVGVKVVFVGDRRQHAAVEAGQPFGYLQGAGLVAVKLDEIQRQARPAEAIHAAAGAAQEGRWKEAARILEGQWKTPLSKLWGKSMPELERAAQAIKEGRHEEALEILETRSMQARALESSVRHASEGRMQDSVSALDGAGKILEIPNRAGRHRAVAEDYLSTPKGQTCIIIAPSNDERCQLNHEVREARIRGGEIDKNSIKIEVRVSKGLTRPQRKELRNYEPGDYIRFGTGSGVYDIERGAEGRVVAVDPERNLVRVELTSGRTAEFNPGRYYGGELGDLAQIETRRLVEGDRIQYRETTRRDGTRVKTGRLKIINGDVGIVKSLNRETGRALVQLEGSADPIALDLTRPQPIDHAYAMTSHLSQSGTYDRSLVVIDTEHSRELVNQAQFYVSVSRAALESKVYTSNRADLVQKVCRQAGKSSALELVQRKAVSSPVPEQVMTAAVGFGGESPLSRGSNEPKRDPRRDVWGRPIRLQSKSFPRRRGSTKSPWP
jgi:hypothetical protein